MSTKKSSKVGRFFSGLKPSKQNPKRKSDANAQPELEPAPYIPDLARPITGDQEANAIGRSASAGLITPKPLDEVTGTHRVFIDSKEYSKWVGKGPSTLICSGQRISSLL